MQTKSIWNGKEINLSSDNMTIKSTNFNVDKNGHVTIRDNGRLDTSNLEITDGQMSNYVTSSGINIGNTNYYGGQEGIFHDNFFFIGTTTDNGNLMEKGIFGQCDTAIFMLSVFDTDNRVDITPTGIITPNIQISNSGYVMHGRNTSHKYKCHWTGSKLLFYVDDIDVSGDISDKRLKTDIKEISKQLIVAIGELEYKSFKKINLNGKISVGIIAQDLKEIFEKYELNPNDYEIFTEFQYDLNDETLYYGIDYTQFLLLRNMANEQKMQEQNNLIQDLLTRVEKLEKGEQHVS